MASPGFGRNTGRRMASAYFIDLLRTLASQKYENQLDAPSSAFRHECLSQLTYSIWSSCIS